MKIAMCASEVVPFAKTGGLADVAGALPLALENLGQEAVIVMPKYKAVHKRDTIIGKNIKVFFIENEAYFNREGLYGDKSGDYKDNLDRFSFYCQGALALLKKINFKPDIIHTHDWQAGLIPAYLKTIYARDPFYKDTRSVLTVHNIGYQGLFPREQFPRTCLDWSLFNPEALEFYDKVNVLKGGLVFSDVINTVSPTYSREIQTQEFGFGLEGILHKRQDSVFGIINGLDYNIWNPETDPFIARKFSVKELEKKYENKKDLQKACAFPLKDDVPLLGIVSRLAEQKGFDILAAGIDEICRLDLQLAILGTGDIKYHQLLEEMHKKYPQKIALFLRFDDPLAHKIYAGSDIFLMPSKYEPCGLGQLISLRYATIPLVFKTGGLADTVTPENGFIFEKYNKDELLKTIKKAQQAFKDKKTWQRLMQSAIGCNFSWEASAREYIRLYEKAKTKK